MSVRMVAAYQANQLGSELKKSTLIKKSVVPAAPAAALPVDTYGSSHPVPTDDRATLVADVKKRVLSGFYNRPEVLEDLGESFAGYFDRALR